MSQSSNFKIDKSHLERYESGPVLVELYANCLPKQETFFGFLGPRHVARIWPGGGAEVSRGQGNPLPKIKKSPDLAHYFSGGTQIHKKICRKFEGPSLKRPIRAPGRLHCNCKSTHFSNALSILNIFRFLIILIILNNFSNPIPIQMFAGSGSVFRSVMAQSWHKYTNHYVT